MTDATKLEATNDHFEEHEIATEAYRLWQADGSPLWGRPEDHWMRALALLKDRRAKGSEDAPVAEPAATTESL